MKLLYTLTTYPPSIGGAQLLQHQLACQLCLRHAIQVVTWWDVNRTDWLPGTTVKAPQDPHDYEIDGISVHTLGLTPSEKLAMLPLLPLYYPFMNVVLPLVARPIAKQLAAFAAKADLIHNVRIGREGISYASQQLARQHHIPFVLTTVHHPRWVGWRYHEYNKLYRSADALIALTQAEKSALVELGATPERVFVTGMGAWLAPEADPEAFRERYKIQEPFVLFIGQHYSYKGYHKLLEAAEHVWKRFPETGFVFLGPPVGDSEAVFQSYSDRRIHRLGKVSLEDKTSALAACTLLCVPSTQESFGAVYLEAWHFAKPAIGCNIPAVSEVIDDGINGFVIEQDAEAIAERICDLLADPQRAADMGAKGQAKYKANFTWDVVARKTEQAYETIR
ncbi:MAG: glycosyltransferase family 4 protein [Anaerolineae bacterium]|nr:glycosyltransferase family 4 protein [Anaerolineae bacterium]